MNKFLDHSDLCVFYFLVTRASEHSLEKFQKITAFAGLEPARLGCILGVVLPRRSRMYSVTVKEEVVS
jgi:hypothetical protein